VRSPPGGIQGKKKGNWRMGKSYGKGGKRFKRKVKDRPIKRNKVKGAFKGGDSKTGKFGNRHQVESGGGPFGKGKIAG